MLILPPSTRAGVITFSDDVDHGLVHVSLAKPRVARRADGSPRFKLVRWTSATGPLDEGALLTIDFELVPTKEDLLAADIDPTHARPLSWTDLRVRLEGPQFEAVDVELALVPGAAAAISARLSDRAAALLSELIRAGSVSPLQVSCIGHVRVRLPPVEVSAVANVSEPVRQSLRTAASAVTRSVIEGNARIDISGGSDPSIERVLREWVLSELTDRLRSGQSLRVHAAAADVISWPVTLATTLDDLIQHATGPQLIETLVLSPEELQSKQLTSVRVLAPFGPRLDRVDIQLQTSLGTSDLAFTNDEAQRVSLDASDVRYRVRTKRAGMEPDAYGPWLNAPNARSVLVPVVMPEDMRLQVLAGALDFNQRWQSVRVELSHQAAGTQQTKTVELNANQREVEWLQPLDGEPSRVAAKISYLSKHGEVIQRSMDDIRAEQLILTDPLDDSHVRCIVAPAGNAWPDIALAMVDLRYAEGDRTVDETVELRELTSLVIWEVPARAPVGGSISWRSHVSFRDGRFRSSEWQNSVDGLVVLSIEDELSYEVNLVSVFFEPAVAQRATVKLYSGHRTTTVELVDRTFQKIRLPPGPFSWSVQWTLRDGRVLPESTAQAGGDVIVLPPCKVPN